MAVISNGDRFSSFQELNDKIQELEISENVEFYKRDVRTIAGARKRNIKRHINENLVVYSAKYACINGGRKYTSNSKGQRPNQK